MICCPDGGRHSFRGADHSHAVRAISQRPSSRRSCRKCQDLPPHGLDDRARPLTRHEMPAAIEQGELRMAQRAGRAFSDRYRKERIAVSPDHFDATA